MKRDSSTYHSDHCSSGVTVAADSVTTANPGLLCWQAGGGQPGHTHGHTDTHVLTHMNNNHKLIYADTQSDTHARTRRAKCSHPRLSCFTAQTQQGPWQTCAHSANWAAGLISCSIATADVKREREGACRDCFSEEEKKRATGLRD